MEPAPFPPRPAAEGRSKSPAMEFEVVASWGKARACRMTLPHVTAELPIFMPVGTQGTIKGLTSAQVHALDAPVILANTYHLALRPGGELLERAGGLHAFMNWQHGLLTDSGGFQMVSLLQLADIQEEGVTFQSPHDGSQMLLTPEISMQTQNQIGADIMMALDDVVSSVEPSAERMEEATHRTTRWLDRCVKAHTRPTEQNLFGIVQGGLDPKLRELSLRDLVARDLPGYAIGGLSGGEAKAKFWRVVNQCTDSLPWDKPRYCMGVGYPLDCVVCACLGVDMTDCVYPTRTGRFGTAMTWGANESYKGGGDDTGACIIRLKAADMAKDLRPLDPTCSCDVCKQHSRAHLHLLLCRQHEVGAQLITYHNIAFMMRLLRELRESIIDGSLPEFVRGFIGRMFPRDDCPEWAREALGSAGIVIK